MSDTIELPNEAVEEVIEALERGMKQGEIAHGHDDIRMSTAIMAQTHKDAYQAMIEAHPNYELTQE